MKQVDAVFQAICQVKGQESFDARVELTKEESEQVIDMVSRGLVEGEVDFSERARAKHDTEEKVRSYTRGMVNNHLRKDLRLNGGTPYKPKNPGSRIGSGDETIREMRKLKSTLSDPDDIAQVQAEIDKRIEHLKAQKQTKIEIDAGAIPEDLRHLVASNEE